MAEAGSHGVEGRITSFDIAAVAGVPQATVTRVLHGEASVSREIRQRIVQIAADLGYSGDKAQREKNYSLSVRLFLDPMTGSPQDNPFASSMVGGLARAAAARGYDLLLTYEPQSVSEAGYYAGGHKADGVILLGAGDFRIYQRRLKQLQVLQIPFVRYCATRDELPGPVVRYDNYQGGLMAVRHLIALGRRRIVFVGNMTGKHPEFAERFRGYTRALREPGVIPLPPLQVDALCGIEAGRAATASIFSRGTPCDAIFAASDQIAIGVLLALKRAGIRVPQDVSVVGFDDISAASLVTPSLTTIVQDTELAGNTLVDMLLRQIAGQSVDSQVLVPYLTIRESCGGGILHG